MASLQLFCAIPFTNSPTSTTDALPSLFTSINLPVPFYLLPARLPLPGVLPIASRRLSVRCYSDDGVSMDLATDELKLQLEALQTEAEQARARANTARARFMRLTETVENLRMRAALDVNAGKEESARQLLEEKQKIVKALEKSKQRAELLDKLSVKLCEAISRKESQLIKDLSSARLKINDSRNDVTSVRIVSPKEEAVAGVKSFITEEIDAFNQNGEEDSRGSVIQDASEICVESGTSDEDCASSDSGYENVDRSDESHFVPSTSPDVFATFLTRIDDQLSDIEIQLHDFMNVAAMILPETIGNTTNAKVAHVKQIWHDIRNTRLRIQTIVEQR